MRTKIDLYLNAIPDAATKKQIRWTARHLAVSTNKKTSVKVDKENPMKVLIQFESPKGRQMDVADVIIDAFSDHFDTYSDIAVSFESTRKNR